MSKGLYLCWLKAGHEKCADHNAIEIVDRIMLKIWGVTGR